MVWDSDLAGFCRVYVVIMGASGIFVYPAIGLYDFFNFSHIHKTPYSKLYARCIYAVNRNKYNTYFCDDDLHCFIVVFLESRIIYKIFLNRIKILYTI